MAKRTILKPYRTYNFRTKDPVIDVLRTAHQDRHLKIRDIAEDSGVSTTTLYNWWHGKTRRPQFATVIAAAKAMDAIDGVVSLIKSKT